MKKTLYIIAILLVTVLALGLRQRAVLMLPIDYDEDDYLGAAQRYALAIKDQDFSQLVEYEYNFEHPALSKLFYGLAIALLPDAPLLPELPPSAPPADNLPQPHVQVARWLSAIIGTLEVLVLAIVNPLAGFFLAINTWQIKYSSQIMLEPLPALSSLLVVVFYTKARGKFNLWMGLSAGALGFTAAAKFPYCIAGVAVAIDWLWVARSQKLNGENKSWFARSVFRWLLLVFAWGIAAIAVFFLLNPRLWVNPVGRLSEALLYHWDYSRSTQVRQFGFPAWQPLVTLSMPVPWHPGVFIFAWDFFISMLAVLGFSHLWKRQRVYALWLALALGFLIVWPTKWPQYILILTAPLSLSAAEGFRTRVWEPLRNQVSTLRTRTLPIPVASETKLARALSRRDLKRALPWLLPGAVGLSLIALYPLIFQGAMALTDFSALSIRDGIQGGVWRAAWQGVTGQATPVDFDVFSGSGSNVVRYAGPTLLVGLISGGAADVLVFNVIWVVLSVSLQVVLGVGVAFLLYRPGVRLRGLWGAIFILPWAIPEFVGALVWMRFFEPRFGWLALAQNIPRDVNVPNWFEDPNLTMLVLLVASLWYGFPFIMLAAIAGLKLIPHPVYDAAALDGASGWSLFRNITWPLLMPLVVPAIIIRSIFAFNQFYLFITLRTEPPLTTFATLSYYLFSPSGFFGGQFAVSAAINIFTVLILVVLILWFNRMSKASQGVTYV